MRRATLFLLLLLPAYLQAEIMTQQPPALVFTHVTVIDATGSAPQPGMTVVVTGDRITALGTAAQVTLPKDAQVVDAAGKFLIPGLWDMHVHIGIGAVDYDPFFPLFVANGITGVRDMGTVRHQGQFDVWRQEIEQGRLVGPRLVAAGSIVDGPRPVYPHVSIAVGNPAAGRLAVDSLKRSGADFVKVYMGLPRDAYFAIADEARKQGIPFAGHVPDSVTATEASDAGQKSIEHLTGVALSCATNESELRAKLKKELMDFVDPDANWLTRMRIEASSLDFCSPEKAASLFARFVKNGTWQCPTLTVIRPAVVTEEENSPIREARLKYLVPTLKRLWKPQENSPQEDRTESIVAERRRGFLRQLELVKAMRQAGIGILAGTDTPSPNCLPGFSLHDELELLVKAGLTPMEALQAATLNPARYLGREKELGTVEVGKVADLVLLDANPLVDIRNTQKINAVVVNGRLLDRARLDQMLTEVEAAARQKP